MQIFDKNDNLILDIIPDDSSYNDRGIMKDHTLVLNYSLVNHVEIPIGSYCEFKGTKYFLLRSQNFKKQNTRNFEYTVLFETEQSLLRNFKFKSIPDVPPRLKFSLTGKPEIFLNLLILNLNASDSGWSIGSILESEELTLDFNDQDCMTALNTISEAFKTEWSIDKKVISLSRVEKDKDKAVPLLYGKGKGLLPGVSRSNYDNSPAITRLYVQGGERNIDSTKYGAKSLLLPKNQIIEYEGRAYNTDVSGTYIERHDKPADTIIEGSIDLSHIYPKWESSVTSVEAVNDEKGLYDFVDLNIPDELDFNNYLLPEIKMLVTFQTGQLSGRQFEINRYDHALRRFEFVPIEESGYVLPKSPIVPAISDKYGVFEIVLPDYYVNLASQNMLQEAVRYMYENEDPRFSFSAELDRIYAKQNWESIGGYMDAGNFIQFSDPQFQAEPVLIRITGVREYINQPYSPVLELSNVVSRNVFQNKMAEISNSEVAVTRNDRNEREFTKRRYRDVKETQQNMFDVLTNYFTEGITPITVETMQVITGSPALQFVFVEASTSADEIDPGINWDNDNSKMYVLSQSYLRHMTLGINYMGGQPALSEHLQWFMPSWESGAIAESDDNSVFYLYAQCPVAGSSGQFLLSKDKIGMSDYVEDGYYYFLIGILNSKFSGERSFAELYGFTEILPGQITARRFQSQDALQFWDFTKMQFQLVDQSQQYGIDWNVSNANKLTIKGGIIQDPGGNSDGMTVWRGEWSESETYYLGNEVSYNQGTYRYVNSFPTAGNNPENVNFWVRISAFAENAQLVSLTATSQVFKYGQGTTGNPNPSVIRLNATTQNIANPVYKWSYGNGSGSWTEFGEITQYSYRDLQPSSNIFTNNSVTIRCTVNGQFYDQMTLAKIADGSDSYTVILENEAHTVACDSQGIPGGGEIGSGGKARTRIIVFKGSAQLTAVFNNPGVNQFSFTFTTANCSAVKSSNSEAYISSISSVSDNAQVFFNISLEGTSTIVSKEMSLTKSKQGADGEGASLLSIRSTGQTFKFGNEKYEGIADPSYIDLTAVTQNLKNTVSWYYLLENGSEVFINNGSTIRVNYSDVYLNNASMRTIRAKVVENSETYSDEITIAKLADGSGGYTCLLTNEAVTLPASEAGVISNYAPATTRVVLYQGAKQILPNYELGNPNLIPFSDDLIGMPITEMGASINYNSIDKEGTTKAGNLYGSGTIRIPGVVKSNGYYSFGVFAKASQTATMYIDICDNSRTPFILTTEWKWIELTGNVNNYSSTIYNFVDLEIQSNGVDYYIYHPILISGQTKPSVWSPALSDIVNSLTNSAGLTSQKSGTDTVSITTLTAGIDSGYVDIAIRYKDFITTKRFSISKSKQGSKGDPGDKGAPGPTLTFRGEYNRNASGVVSTQTYYGNSIRRDVVKYNNRYYITKETAGQITGIVPTNTVYWDDFGAQFSSVATGLLFAETALIAGWNFNQDMIWSQNNNMGIDGRVGQPVRLWIGATIENRESAPTRLMDDGSIYSERLIARGANIQGKLESSTSGNKIVINPDNNAIEMIDSNGRNVTTINFKEESQNNISYVTPDMNMKYYVNGVEDRSTDIKPGQIQLRIPDPDTIVYASASRGIGIEGGGSAFVANVRGYNNALNLTLLNLPTSGANLPSGAVWRDGDTLKVVI